MLVVTGAEIGALQVVEQPANDVALAHGSEQVLVEFELTSAHLVQDAAAVLFVDRAAVLERIEDQIAGLAGESHHEVPGESDAFERNAEPPAELHEHDGQRERNTAAPAHDFVKQ